MGPEHEGPLEGFPPTGPVEPRGKPVELNFGQTTRAGEHNFEYFFNLVDDLLFVLDADGRILKANRAACSRLEYSESELLGLPVSLLHPREQLDDVAAAVAAMIAGHQDLCTIPVVSKSGRQIPVETRVVVGEWDRRPALFGVTRDVSEIRASEQKFATIFHSSPLLMALSTVEDGVFVDVNETFLEVLGYCRAEIIGRTSQDLSLFGGLGTRDLIVRAIQQEGPQRGLEVVIQGASGKRHVGLFSAEILRIGERDLLLTSMLDITDRKAAVEERDLLFQYSADLLSVVGFDGRFRQVNPAWTKTLGWTEDELLSRPWLDFVHPEDIESTRRAGEQIAAGQRIVCFANRYRCRDGSWVWLSWITSPLPETGLAFAVARNITEKKATEKALQESEERLQLALGGADLGTWDWDVPSGNVVFNRRWAEMLGFDPGEIQPHIESWEALIHPEDHARVLEELRRHLQGEVDGYDTEHRLRHKSGSWVWVHDKGRVTKRDGAGTPLRMAGTHQDISRRKWYESQLVESEARFRLIVEGVPDAIFILGEDERLVEVNHAASKLTGRTRSELLGAAFTSVLTAESAWEVQHRLVSSDCPPLPLEVAVLRIDGSRVLVDLKMTAIFLRGVPCRLAVAHDLTERKRVEEERLVLERRLLDTQKMESLGVLAGGIAHDFNNLLTAILGNVDLALMDLPGLSPARECLEEVGRSARRAAHLTSQMLAYSGKGQFLLQPIDLNQQILEVCSSLRPCLPAEAAIRCDLSQPLPSMTGDPLQVRQLISNLVNNAAEAIGNRPGLVSVATGVAECDRNYLDSRDTGYQPALPGLLDEGLYVFLEVSDNGSGMDEEVRRRAFEPFFSTKFLGRGLGLPAVLGIVRGHRGILKLESQVDRGSKVRVLFPTAEFKVNQTES